MKTGFIKLFGSIILTASCAIMIGCEIPEERKSLFQKAATAQTDSNSIDRNSDEKRIDEPGSKQEAKKKPRAYIKVDRVAI